jgi:hypothetical protein
MNTFLSLIGRVGAVFGSSALAAVAGGAVAKVTEALLKAYADDGVLDAGEISAAFGGNNSMTTAKKARRKAPAQEV